MTKAFLIAATVAISIAGAGAVAAQDFSVYGDTGVRYDSDGYRWDGGARSSYYGGGYSSGSAYGGVQYGYGDGYYSGSRHDGDRGGSVYGRGSYSSESRHYDSGWRRADGYAPYPAPGYGGGYYAHGRTGAYVDGRYGYDYRYGAPYAQGYAYGYSYSNAQPYRHGYDRHDRYDRGGRYGYSDRRDHDRRGYRDWYGYNDDRPSSRAVYDARDYYYGRDDDCRCSDVYLYDR